MNVGLPGTGLAGLFYLLAALWMPCHAAVRAVRGDRDAARWRLALTQAALALAIVAAIAATAWALGLPLPTRDTGVEADPSATGVEAGPATPATQAARFLGVAPTVVAVATLAVVLLLLEVVGIVAALRRRRGSPVP